MGLFIEPESEPGAFVSKQNRARQFDFLHTSWVIATYGVGLQIDHEFVCELNRYATHYISPQPGQYRRHYNVRVGEHRPSEWYLVYEEMDQFLEVLNSNWGKWDAVMLAAYALWGVCNIHPFADGNGRAARALCYFVFCRKQGAWLRGRVAFIELIKEHRDNDYCAILQRMHDAKTDGMLTNLDEMTAFLNEMILAQLATADS
nr:Fic family protein [Croceicoccus sp. Ery5]